MCTIVSINGVSVREDEKIISGLAVGKNFAFFADNFVGGDRDSKIVIEDCVLNFLRWKNLFVFLYCITRELCSNQQLSW